MENKKKLGVRFVKMIDLIIIENTSGLVQQHASGSCSPKIPRLTNSETVQLPIHMILVAPPTAMEA